MIPLKKALLILTFLFCYAIGSATSLCNERTYGFNSKERNGSTDEAHLISNDFIVTQATPVKESGSCNEKPTLPSTQDQPLATIIYIKEVTVFYIGTSISNAIIVTEKPSVLAIVLPKTKTKCRKRQSVKVKEQATQEQFHAPYPSQNPFYLANKISAVSIVPSVENQIKKQIVLSNFPTNTTFFVANSTESSANYKLQQSVTLTQFTKYTFSLPPPVA